MQGPPGTQCPLYHGARCDTSLFDALLVRFYSWSFRHILFCCVSSQNVYRQVLNSPRESSVNNPTRTRIVIYPRNIVDHHTPSRPQEAPQRASSLHLTGCHASPQRDLARHPGVVASQQEHVSPSLCHAREISLHSRKAKRNRVQHLVRLAPSAYRYGKHS